MFHVNSVSNRPITQFFQAQPELGPEQEAAQQQIPEKSAVPTPAEVYKCYRAEKGFLVLDHVYVVSERCK